jgi:hypothetical protein
MRPNDVIGWSELREPEDMAQKRLHLPLITTRINRDQQLTARLSESGDRAIREPAMKLHDRLSLMALIFLGSFGRNSYAVLSTNASLTDDIVSLIYDPRDGSVGLDLNRYTPGTGVYFAIHSREPFFTGTVPDPVDDCRIGLNQCSPMFFSRGGVVPDDRILSFGPYAESGLPISWIATNVSGFVDPFDAQPSVITDVFFVPEPTGFHIVTLVTVSLLFRGYRRRC